MTPSPPETAAPHPLTVTATRGLRIAITIGLREEGEGLWINGIKQNALALAMLLKGSPRGHRVCLANTTAVAITPGLPWDLAEFPTLPLADVLDDIDLLVALGGAVPASVLDHLHDRGAKAVAYKCGAEYVMSMQSALFGRDLGGEPHYPSGYDAIWAVPQVARSSSAFWRTLHRVPVRTVPFVWSERWLEAHCATLPHHGRCMPRPGPKRISIMEPNHDVVKFCLYPLMVAELAWRQRPDLIEFVSVTNTGALRKSAEFVGVVKHLDLVREHRAFFEDRFITPDFLANHTDVVVSHQWENPLNYAYLEAAWLGYPLVHNADLPDGLGWRYDGFDVETGAAQLIAVLVEDPAGDDAWMRRQQAAVQRYRASDATLMATYDNLLDDLMAIEPGP
jgi:hypothetical protein